MKKYLIGGVLFLVVGATAYLYISSKNDVKYVEETILNNENNENNEIKIIDEVETSLDKKKLL